MRFCGNRFLRLGRGSHFGLCGGGGFADIGPGSVLSPLAPRLRLSGVVTEGGVGDGDAGRVEVVGDLGKRIALIAESGDFGMELLDGLADGVRRGDRRGQGSEEFASLNDRVW